MVTPSARVHPEGTQEEAKRHLCLWEHRSYFGTTNSWILIGVGAFAPNQMESGVMGDYFRSKNGSIGWVHTWAKSLGAVGLPGARWAQMCLNQTKPNRRSGHTPCGPFSRPWRYRPVFDKDPGRPCPSSPMRLQTSQTEIYSKVSKQSRHCFDRSRDDVRCNSSPR